MQKFRTLKEFEYRYILRAVMTHKGNRTRAARALGVSVRTVRMLTNQAIYVDGILGVNGMFYNIGELTPLKEPKKLRDVRFKYIVKVLEACRGIREIAACVLGVCVRSMRGWVSRLKKANIAVPRSQYNVEINKLDTRQLKVLLSDLVVDSERFKRLLEICRLARKCA